MLFGIFFLSGPSKRGLSVHLSIITTSGPAVVLSHHLLSWTSRQPERPLDGTRSLSLSFLFFASLARFNSAGCPSPFHFEEHTHHTHIRKIEEMPAHIPVRSDTWCQAGRTGRARAHGPIPQLGMSWPILCPSHNIRHNGNSISPFDSLTLLTLYIRYWLDYIQRYVLLLFIFLFFPTFVLFFLSLKHLTNQITNCPEQTQRASRTTEECTHLYSRTHTHTHTAFLFFYFFSFLYIYFFLLSFGWTSRRHLQNFGRNSWRRNCWDEGTRHRTWNAYRDIKAKQIRSIKSTKNE